MGIRALTLAIPVAAALQLSASGADSKSCGACHPEEADGYLKTGMGRSMSRQAIGPEGEFEHPTSASTFSISSGESGLLQRVERRGLSAEYPIEYVIGSGNAALGYLIRVGDSLYQSPVAYYTKRKRWDMAPGMETHPNPDFDRPVLHECLWCHAGEPEPVAGSQNRYAESALNAEVITCDRCHGPLERHLAAPSAETIINPIDLDPTLRDSVCEQCHLSGEQRVLNPGKTFGDFTPGMRLEDVFSVYIGSDSGQSNASARRFKVVSHFEQLALSRCYQQTGSEMWCGTCHSPHEKPSDPKPYYRARCLDCHGEALLETHAEPSDDCVSCHMARRLSHDSGHSAFTDHLIARRPPAERQGSEAAPALRAWRDPTDPVLATRNLGLAYLEAGQRKKQEDYLDEGAALLARLAQQGQLDAEGLKELGSVLMLKQAPPEAGLKPLAVQLLRDALKQKPQDAEYHRALAAALWQTGKDEEAIELLNQAIKLDPQVRSAYSVLAEIHQQAGRSGLAVQTWERYLELVPLSLAARSAVAGLADRQ